MVSISLGFSRGNLMVLTIDFVGGKGWEASAVSIQAFWSCVSTNVAHIVVFARSGPESNSDTASKRWPRTPSPRAEAGHGQTPRPRSTTKLTTTSDHTSIPCSRPTRLQTAQGTQCAHSWWRHLLRATHAAFCGCAGERAGGHAAAPGERAEPSAQHEQRRGATASVRACHAGDV